MSYSVSGRGATVALALVALAAALDEVVINQPIHAVDIADAKENAAKAAGLLAIDDTQDVSVCANGWVQWTGGTEVNGAIPPTKIVGVSISASANLVARPAPEPQAA